MAFTYRQAQKIVAFEVQQQLARAADKNNRNVQCIPLLLAGVGTGKTALAEQVAVDISAPLITINCGETGDATEITGFPLPSAIVKDTYGSYIGWVLNQALHYACHEPVVLLFDDIDKIPHLVEGALIGLFGKREIKGQQLHPGTVLIAAGNRVTDDHLARDLSESLRTRATPIEMVPTLGDFRVYSKESGKVHAAVMGYLEYKPAHLHERSDNTLRFPTQRCWVEASQHMNLVPNGDRFGGKNDAWKTIIELKCGSHVGSDFDAWYSIVRKIDVQMLLTKGVLVGTDANDSEHMLQYAAVYAVAQELNNNGADKSYTGLATYLEKVEGEMRVAMLTQLNKKARDGIASKMKKTADLLLCDLILQQEAAP